MARIFVVALCALVISTLGCEHFINEVAEEIAPRETTGFPPIPWISFPAPDNQWYIVMAGMQPALTIDFFTGKNPLTGTATLSFTGVVNETDGRPLDFKPIGGSPQEFGSNLPWEKRDVNIYETTLPSPYSGLIYRLTLNPKTVLLKIQLINDFGD